MKISIIVPVYNVPPALFTACLDSLAEQTLRQHEYEIILVDDCSTDSDTTRMAQAFSERVSNAKIIQHSSNLGLNEARRSGVKNAQGNYVIFVDGDDILTKDAIENLRMEAAKTNADLVTAPFLRWNVQNKTFTDLPITAKLLPSEYVARLKAVLSGKMSFTMCGRLFRRTLLTDSLFDLPIGQLHEDITTFVRFCFKAKIVSHVQRPLYYYTLNQSSITNNFTENHARGMLAGIQDWIINAQDHELIEQLVESIAQGAEKLINTCIERCILSENLSIDEKVTILGLIGKRYDDLPLPRYEPRFQGTKFLLENSDFTTESFGTIEQAKQEFAKTLPAQSNPNAVLKYGLEPSQMAQWLKDKIVFIGQVDYQIRNAAAFARALRLHGHPSAILDNSAFASGGLRQLTAKDKGIFWRTDYIKIDTIPYGIDWLSSAKLVIVFNDFNDDFREALEYRNRLGLPSICAIEGINDFLRVDFQGYRYLPYRRCSHVFLAGENDRKYFEDRHTYVSGLPIIETLVSKTPSFPAEPLAVLNVNFTYGALENERAGFVTKAKRAFEAVGIDWTITQHPMDKGALSELPVSKKSQYELIDECSVFVSRFATGILEALASGKPAIYFNPHGEKVEKFQESLGAFEIATTEEELAKAIDKTLQDIKNGVDFRKRAQPFLKHHTAYDPDGPSICDLFTDAVKMVLNATAEQHEKASHLFFEKMADKKLFDVKNSEEVIFGDFDRRHKAQLNEEEMIGRYFGKRGKLMIDVGANFGNSLDIYLGKGWDVHAFEPDPNNRKKLLDFFSPSPQLTINEEAVSNKAGEKVPFFASAESSGISGLSAFTDGHDKICEVFTTTLRDYYAKQDFSHADFLKIDVEGFDKFVLDGFPWEKDKPEVVLAEFEDDKTVPLGYTTSDLANTLLQQGYTVYVSEWMPIVRYGIAHDWRRLIRYSKRLDLSNTWGNLIGFLRDPGEDALRHLAIQTVKFAIKPTPAKKPAPAKNAPSPKTPIQSKGRPIPPLMSKPSSIASRRWAKLKRDPHIFFRDSHFALLRPLRHFFKPTGISKRQAEMTSQIAEVRGGFFSFLPIGRKVLLKNCAMLRNEHANLEAELRIELEKLQQDLRGRETALRNQIVHLRNEIDKNLVEEQRKTQTLQDKFVTQMVKFEQLFTNSMNKLADAEAAIDDNIVNRIAEIRKVLETEIATFKRQVAEVQSVLTSGDVVRIGDIKKLEEETSRATKSEIAVFRTSFDQEKRISAPANAGIWRVHDRYLSQADISHIQKEWLRPLGLFLSPKQLGYMAHHIGLAEERCEGRMATTIQAAMLRSLALLSLQTEEIELMEIGTLFGIGAGTLHQVGTRAQRKVTLTLIDPLDGYYKQRMSDESTGVPVTRETLVKNMRSLDIPEQDYRIIQHLSTDAAAIKAASDRSYDYILIDGDHSLEGVAADFELYSSMIKPGGVIIFDDYATTDWPSIQAFVDENVRGNSDWLWIGGEWRTGILRRKRNASAMASAIEKTPTIVAK